ncbi:MAG: hypothetical protein DSM106950_44020 [Stigonema ocellatum SAG 48.90 = DSM 106950]|nr:hypothetical protein [Stigonema ocellatum SAG 48.90 = DSM 106950]
MIAGWAVMAESPMVGARVPQEWLQQIQGIAAASGRTEAQIVSPAIAAYLGQVNPDGVSSALASLQSRVEILEGKLASLGRLVG